MKPLPPSMVRTIGGLLALAVVLALAISYLETETPGRSHTATTVAPLALPPPGSDAADSGGEAPAYAVVDSHDVSSATRRRLSVEIVMDAASSPGEVEQAVVEAAEAIQSRDDHLTAIMVSAFAADARSDVGLRRLGWLVWSPDGRGWDGTADNDFGKHIFSEPPPQS